MILWVDIMVSSPVSCLSTVFWLLAAVLISSVGPIPVSGTLSLALLCRLFAAIAAHWLPVASAPTAVALIFVGGLVWSRCECMVASTIATLFEFLLLFDGVDASYAVDTPELGHVVWCGFVGAAISNASVSFSLSSFLSSSFWTSGYLMPGNSATETPAEFHNYWKTLQRVISRLRDFARRYDKTSYCSCSLECETFISHPVWKINLIYIYYIGVTILIVSVQIGTCAIWNISTTYMAEWTERKWKSGRSRRVKELFPP